MLDVGHCVIVWNVQILQDEESGFVHKREDTLSQEEIGDIPEEEAEPEEAQPVIEEASSTKALSQASSTRLESMASSTEVPTQNYEN